MTQARPQHYRHPWGLSDHCPVCLVPWKPKAIKKGLCPYCWTNRHAIMSRGFGPTTSSVSFWPRKHTSLYRDVEPERWYEVGAVERVPRSKRLTKRCPKCQVIKGMGDFECDDSTDDGRHEHCKQCIIESRQVVITHKACSKCKVDKPTERFGINELSNDGYNSQCKACNSQYVKSKRKRKKRKPRKPTHKTCPMCKAKKRVAEFYLIKKTGRFSAYCRPCMSDYQRNHKRQTKLWR